MPRLNIRQATQNDERLTRREFLRVGGLSLAGASLLPESAGRAQTVPPRGKAVRCILLNLTGGPSHLDTWDMKPHAPAGIRSPFQPVKTNVPGIEICEIFPRMAHHADKFSIVRSMHCLETVCGTRHSDQPFKNLFGEGLFREGYETRLETAQAGRASIHHGAFKARTAIGNSPGFITLPFPEAITAHSRAAFDLDRENDREADRETEATRARYGHNRFGQSCLLARRLVERGARFVRVDMFDNRRESITWDAHGSAPFPALDAYKSVCGPVFDNAYASLIEDLMERGLYESTIVLASGEFGRTPKINVDGGRDHWPHCWSLVIGGGGIRGGRVVGASDAIGGYPVERPVTPADIAATLHSALGINPAGSPFTPDRKAFGAAETAARPVHELL